MGDKPTYEELEHLVNELQKKEKQYRSVIEDQNEFIVRWLPNGVRTFVNSSYCKYYGKCREELIGSSFFPLIDPADLKKVQERINRLTPENPILSDVHRVVLPDGGVGWNHWTDRAIFDADGQVVEYQSVGRDITEHKQAEEALHENKVILDSFLENSPVYIFFKDHEIRSLMLSKNYEQLLNMPLENILGKTMDELFPSDIAKRMVEEDKQVLSERKNVTVMEEFGGRIYETTKFPISIDGKPNMLAGFTLDITERKQAEDSLRKERDFSTALIQTSPAFIVLIGMDGKVMMMNNSMLAALGYKREEVVGRDYLQTFVPTEEQPELGKTFKVILGGLISASTTNHIVTHDGQKLFTEWRGVPLFDASNEIQCFFGIGIDITEQKLLEEQLRQAQKMEAIGTLAGGIAHDFNNILSVILGYSELILEGLSDDSPIFEDIKLILDSGKKASALTNQLLAFSRKQVLEMRKIDLNSVVENMAKMFGRIIGEDIELELKTDTPTKKVLADLAQIEQVLMNLVVNARDAMPKGGCLIIETKDVQFETEIISHHEEIKPGRYTVVAISDSGGGMTTEIQKKIFEPFFTTKEKSKGTGLGLATVYGIVKQHNGYIYVYSEQGEGTTFKIYLPIAEGKPDQLGSQIPNSKPKGNETVLIVEDDETIRQLIFKILKPLGYTVLGASNGQEALDISATYEGNIDLLLTDVIMPGMNGRVLADKLKGGRPATKVVFMSGHTDNVIAQHGILESGVTLIQKPLSSQLLASKLRTVLDQ